MVLRDLPSVFGPQSSDVFRSVLHNMWDRYGEASGVLEMVPVSSLTPVSRYVVRSRLARAEIMVKQMGAIGVSCFAPVVAFGGAVRLVMPPLVEEHSGQLFLLDGTHRVYTARRLGIRGILVSLIRDVNLPLPSAPTCWADYKIVDHNPSISDNHIDLDKSLFRPGTLYFNSLKFDDLEGLAKYVRKIGGMMGDE